MKTKFKVFWSILVIYALCALPMPAITSPIAPSSQLLQAANLNNRNAPESNIVVNTDEDMLDQDGDCSLREAVQAANTNEGVDGCVAGNEANLDTITFTISGTITVTAQLSVNAGGALLIDGSELITIKGDGKTRLFSVDTAANLTLDALKLTNGFRDNENGAGIINTGILTLKNSTLTKCSSWGMNNGGAGIYNTGTMTITNSTVSSNTSFYHIGAGIYNTGKLVVSNSNLVGNYAYHDGGGIFNTGVLAIIDSTLSGNSVNYKGGGVFSQSGTILIKNSTLSGNGALNGGAIYSQGSVYIINSTLSGNHASNNGGGVYSQGTLSISSSTISGNSSGLGGGVYSPGGFWMKNSILANNTSTYHGPNCSGGFSSYSHNLVGDAEDCYFMKTTGDLVGIDPKLEPLQDNGGASYTQALSTGSLAINGGNPNGCKDFLDLPISADQRGQPRFGRCDIGAFEWRLPTTGPNPVFLPLVSRACSIPLYFDDFSNQNSGWPVIVDQPTFRVEYLDNEYRILINTIERYSGVRHGFAFSDFVAVTDVRNDTNVYGSYGLIFGISNDWNQFYLFEIYPDGIYNIVRHDSQDSWTVLAGGESGSIYHGTASNQLKIERKGSQIWAYANGQLLNILQDGTFIGARDVGMIATSGNQIDVDIRFDNFTLYPIDCGASNTFPDQIVGGDIFKPVDFIPSKNWLSLPIKRVAQK